MELGEAFRSVRRTAVVGALVVGLGGCAMANDQPDHPERPTTTVKCEYVTTTDGGDTFVIIDMCNVPKVPSGDVTPAVVLPVQP